MKWPSSSASAARNSARISSSVIISQRGIRLRGGAPSTPRRAIRTRRLRLRKAAPIEPRKSGGADLRLRFQHVIWGADETDWMGDRLGRGLAYTCGCARHRKCARHKHACSRSADAAPPAGFAQDSAKPDAATANPAQEPVAAALPTVAPTPGIGQPDGRMSLQDQVTPIGREAAGFHDTWLLSLCAIICVDRPGAAAVGDDSLSPRRQTRCRRATRTTPRSR